MEEVLIKSSANFQSLKALFSALHSGAVASHLKHGINRSNKIISNYGGNTGMGWRTDLAQKSINKNTPLLTQHRQNYQDYANTLSDAQKKWLKKGKNLTAFAYDIPKSLAFLPSSKMGIVPSLGLYYGLGMAGINADPFSRAGQLHGLTNAKDIAESSAREAGQYAADEFIQGFDGLGFKDRFNAARNPNIFGQGIPQEYTDSLNGIGSDKGFRFSDFIRGAPTFTDDIIRDSVAQGVNSFKM
jgi:hypothetical protein